MSDPIDIYIPRHGRRRPRTPIWPSGAAARQDWLDARRLRRAERQITRTNHRLFGASPRDEGKLGHLDEAPTIQWALWDAEAALARAAQERERW